MRVTAAAFALLAGCSESTAVRGSQGTSSEQMLRSIVVSGPLSTRSAASVSDVASDSALVYVAMHSGTLTEGTSVRVSVSSGTGAVATGPMLDGGFDPIGLIAHPSDSLDVEALGANDAAIARVRVPTSRAPTMIRSLPARGGTGVQLGEIITIVFSQPLDPATVDATSIRLLWSGAVVPCVVSVKAAEPWVVELQPSAPLKADSRYVVMIGTGMKDVGGNPLVATGNFNFRTGAKVIVPVSIVVRTYTGFSPVESDIAIASPSEQVSFAIAAVTADADTVVSASLPAATWTSSDPRVATVNSLGVASAISPGHTEIQACASSFCAHATLRVSDPSVSAASTAIGDLGGGWSSVADVSGEQVAGLSTRSDGTRDVFLWSRLRGLEDLGVVNFESSIVAQRVNQNGMVIVSGARGSWIYTRETGVQQLPFPDSHPNWYAGAMNSQGTVVFHRDSGTVIGFWNASTGGRVVPSPSRLVFAQRMNDAGQVVLSSGDYHDDAFPRDNVAYLWDSNADRVISTIVSRDFVTHRALFIYPTSINSDGDVAGYVSSFPGGETTAFTWSASRGFRYLKMGDLTIETAVVGLNDSGDAAVSLSTYTHGRTNTLTTARGAVWTAAGDLIMLESADPFVFPVGISNTGSVSGNTSPDESHGERHAHVWDVGSLYPSRKKDAPVVAASSMKGDQ
jgi:Big-like domain-containing protein